MNKKKEVMRYILIIVSVFVLIQCQMPLEDQRPYVISLDQKEWQFSEKDSLTQYPAVVPGSVHMDLLANGLIEAPYFGMNEKDLQWIGERDWRYTTTFKLAPEIINQEHVELCFDGLDTYADVYLNGQKILVANNYFRTWKANVKGFLQTGDNKLEVQFRSSVAINAEMRQNDRIPLFDDYVYSRKPAFHYGWDWGPVFITSGIWRPVYLKAWSEASIKDQFIIQENVTKARAKIKAEVEIESLISADAQLVVSCLEADVQKTVPVSLIKGINKISCNVVIDQPELWWSNGLGDANLYTIETKLIREGRLLDSDSKRIGIRDIKLVQNPDEHGASFHFELNGVPVFAKGANYIPQESFQSKVDSADYRKVIQHAIDANMNMLRVWGGGFYEEDYFYDLCDENGILVWQDFMFACSMYPGEEDYLENVKQEAIENVKRLRNHPSIALWCGNNENYIGWKDWRWPARFEQEDSAAVWNDYLMLFEKLLPEVIAEYDPGKDYWPSSPKHGWGYPVNSDGDSHLWAVWHAQDPFEVLLEKENIPRFMSEYGFQSLPEMKTIEAFTLPEDRDIDSDVMKAHQKHRVGYPVIDKYIKRDYNWPKDFESYVYVSQVLQAKGIKMGIEAHRRAMPFCMGTLYWQLNDCWPVASWSSVDYYNRWKALHYKVRDAYANVLVSPVMNEANFELYIVSDLTSAQEAQLKIELLDFEGNVIWETESNQVIPVNTTEQVMSLPVKSILKNHAANEVVLNVELDVNNQVIAQNQLYLVSPKELALKNPELSFSIDEVNSDTLTIELHAKQLAKDVCLSFPETEGFFTDNYFDLIPGKGKTVMFITNKQNNNVNNGELVIKSLKDSY